ncbi:MAG: DUF3592 domain-containing protein [Anaerolineales bacterium]|nr:DUF3592 domain-containing protein [Anaerolineales bacterium]
MAGALEKSTSFISGCWNGLGAGCGWVVFNLMWVVMLGVAAWYGYGSYTLTTSGRTVTGTVIENRVVSDSDGDTYKPVIEYEVNGQTYAFESPNSASPPAYAVGERVTLRYNPDNPQDARINSLWELWLLPCLLGPAALVLAVVINGGYFLAWRRGTLFEGSDD